MLISLNVVTSSCKLQATQANRATELGQRN